MPSDRSGKHLLIFKNSSSTPIFSFNFSISAWFLRNYGENVCFHQLEDFSSQIQLKLEDFSLQHFDAEKKLFLLNFDTAYVSVAWKMEIISTFSWKLGWRRRRRENFEKLPFFRKVTHFQSQKLKSDTTLSHSPLKSIPDQYSTFALIWMRKWFRFWIWQVTTFRKLEQILINFPRKSWHRFQVFLFQNFNR